MRLRATIISGGDANKASRSGQYERAIVDRTGIEGGEGGVRDRESQEALNQHQGNAAVVRSFPENVLLLLQAWWDEKCAPIARARAVRCIAKYCIAHTLHAVVLSGAMAEAINIELA